MNVRLNIDGMHCVKCAARLQKALAETEGVISAEVSKDTDSANVEFDDKQLSLEGIKSVVDDCGFSVVD